LHAKLGSTVLIVTHDMGVAEQCARTVRLRDGHVVEDSRNAVVSKRK
jgi:predicted ABC-type transport system involved in lysophospholipase L1 biosynthesis ATPase subunit